MNSDEYMNNHERFAFIHEFDDFGQTLFVKCEDEDEDDDGNYNTRITMKLRGVQADCTIGFGGGDESEAIRDDAFDLLASDREGARVVARDLHVTLDKVAPANDATDG